MRLLVLAAAAAAFSLPAQAATAPLRLAVPPRLGPAAQQRIVAAVPKLGPRSRDLVAREAARIVRTGDVSEGPVRSAIQTSGLGPLANGDIDALMTLIMMQAAKEADDELREQMEAMKAATKQKQAERDHLNAVKGQQTTLNGRLVAAGIAPAAPALRIAPLPPPRFTLDAYQRGAQSLDDQIDEEKAQKDSLGELGEEQQLRLQMLMDRRKQAMEILSNLMKKFADTSDTITKNLP
jgi:hypothetical protein